MKYCVGASTSMFKLFLLRFSFVDMAAIATVLDILSQPSVLPNGSVDGQIMERSVFVKGTPKRS